MVSRALVLFLAAALVGCSGANTHPGLREIPKGLVHVVFRDIDDAPLVEISGRDAVALRDKVEAEHKRTYLEEGHAAWFFHAFDDEHLHFLVARWEGEEVGGTYHVLTRYQVRRTRRIESALGVAEEIAAYERGVGEVRAGMSLGEVEAAHGAPDRVIQLGPFGAFDYEYKDLCVRFLEGRAAHLWPPEACQRE